MNIFDCPVLSPAEIRAFFQKYDKLTDRELAEEIEQAVESTLQKGNAARVGAELLIERLQRASGPKMNRG